MPTAASWTCPARGPAESFMQVRVSAQPAARHEAIRARVEAVLEDVRAAVDDWHTMRARCWTIVAELEKNPPPLPRREIAEGIAFLEWLVDNHFTFLGYREYSFEGEGEAAVARVLPETGLGILRNEAFPIFEGLRNLGTLPEDVRHFLRQPALLLITKANRLSTVHRPVPMDAIAVKCFDPKGNVTGERIFVGLFTASAYSRSPRTIPILRQKVESSLERAGFPSDSHDGKALTNILETYPARRAVPDLRGRAVPDRHGHPAAPAAAEDRPVRAPRSVRALRLLPGLRAAGPLRHRPAPRLPGHPRPRLPRQGARTHTHLTDEALARLHFHVATTPGRIPNVDPEDVERQLQDAARSWGERLQEALVEKHGEEEGLAPGPALRQGVPGRLPGALRRRRSGLRRRAAGAAPSRPATSPSTSTARPEPAPGEVALKIYGSGGTVPLSDILPMLENMGLKVLEEMPYEVRPAESGGRSRSATSG